MAKKNNWTKSQVYNTLAEILSDGNLPSFKTDDDGNPEFKAKHAKFIIEEVLTGFITDNLKPNGKIPLGNLVAFKLVDRAGRKHVKNPFYKTRGGDKYYDVPPKRVIKAQLPKALRDMFNQVKGKKKGKK